MVLPLYFDIDGTLTDSPVRGGKPLADRIAEVRRLIDQKVPVVLWSGGGTDYARAFADQHGLSPLACLGKPMACIDDNPTIRPSERMRIIAPEDFFDK